MKQRLKESSKMAALWIKDNINNDDDESVSCQNGINKVIRNSLCASFQHDLVILLR